MLSNKYSLHHLLEYKKNYLKVFNEETSKSFDYFVNNYLSSKCIFLSIDSDDNFALGLMIIPKTIISFEKKLNACLIYGVVASEKYRHTHILHKLFPNFLSKLKSEYDVILIESHYWKIYNEFNFCSINKYIEFRKNNMINNNSNSAHSNLFHNSLIAISDDIINSCLKIFNKQVENFKIKSYVDLNFSTLKHFFNVNLLMNDQLFFFSDSFGVYSKKNKSLSAIHFESVAALKKLVQIIPNDVSIIIDQNFVSFLPSNVLKSASFVKTKILSEVYNLETIFFSEFN